MRRFSLAIPALALVAALPAAAPARASIVIEVGQSWAAPVQPGNLVGIGFRFTFKTTEPDYNPSLDWTAVEVSSAGQVVSGPMTLVSRNGVDTAIYSFIAPLVFANAGRFDVVMGYDVTAN